MLVHSHSQAWWTKAVSQKSVSCTAFPHIYRTVSLVQQDLHRKGTGEVYRCATEHSDDQDLQQRIQHGSEMIRAPGICSKFDDHCSDAQRHALKLKVDM